MSEDPLHVIHRLLGLVVKIYGDEECTLTESLVMGWLFGPSRIPTSLTSFKGILIKDFGYYKKLI